MSTTRERILAAAVTCFARDGFNVGLREIGAEAGFSAALVVRHFGSKDALRQACDEHVAAVVRQSKMESVRDAGLTSVLTQLAQVEEYADLLGYTVRSLIAGGELAQKFVEQMVADAITYLAEGERTGLITPSRDPDARARYLTYANLGGLLMQLQTEHPDVSDIRPVFQEVLDRQVPPAVEVYTDGLFADSRILDMLSDAGYTAAELTPASTPSPDPHTDGEDQ